MDRLEIAQEKENRRKGIIATFAIHAVLLILFLLFKLHLPLKDLIETNEIIVMDFRERGSTPDLGNTTTGQGDGNNGDPTASENPNNTPPKPEPVVKPIVTPNKPIPSTNKPIVTTNDITAPKITKAELDAIKKKQADDMAKAISDAKAKAELDKKIAEEKAFQDKMNSGFNKGKTGVSGQGNDNSQGNTGNTNGDFGVNNGKPNGSGLDNGTGGASDGLGNFDLGGRKLVKQPTLNDASQKTGRVVVRIKVDQNGNVLFAEYTSKNSNTTDQYLIGLAIKAAKTAKFNASPQAMEEQWGTMTFNFKF